MGQEKAQQMEMEQAISMQANQAKWAWEDALYKHERNCTDSECAICESHLDDLESI